MSFPSEPWTSMSLNGLRPTPPWVASSPIVIIHPEPACKVLRTGDPLTGAFARGSPVERLVAPVRGRVFKVARRYSILQRGFSRIGFKHPF